MAGLIEHTVLNDLRNVVSKSAPLLGTLLGSPMARVGINLLGSFFNIDSDDIQGILDKVTANPEAAEALKKIEYEHKEMLLQIAARNYETEVSDRKDARAMAVSLHSNVPTILAIGMLLIYAAIQTYCILTPGTEDDIISARLQDIMIMVISFYFGSSHKEKLPQA